MKIIDIILSLAPAICSERVEHYFGWLNDCEELWNMIELYENFQNAFPDLSGGEARVIFGIWFATKGSGR